MLDKQKVGKAISEQKKQKGMIQKQLADLPAPCLLPGRLHRQNT